MFAALELGAYLLWSTGEGQRFVALVTDAGTSAGLLATLLGMGLPGIGRKVALAIAGLCFGYVGGIQLHLLGEIPGGGLNEAGWGSAAAMALLTVPITLFFTLLLVVFAHTHEGGPDWPAYKPGELPRPCAHCGHDNHPRAVICMHCDQVLPRLSAEVLVQTQH